ncbi:MAG: LysR family transcriptional regulator [Ignavibacteriales bacterium]
MLIEEKIKTLGFSVPAPAKPLAAYIPAIQTGDLVFTSGQVPLQDGVILYTGQVPVELSVEDARKAAEICCLNCLAAIKGVAGSLDAIDRIIKVTVFVNSSAGFGDQPVVANGASELLEKIFGDKGKHVRAAVGAAGLPKNSSVEIEMVVKLKPLN